jgi:predicted CXXCH cytochrome family protein
MTKSRPKKRTRKSHRSRTPADDGVAIQHLPAKLTTLRRVTIFVLGGGLLIGFAAGVALYFSAGPMLPTHSVPNQAQYVGSKICASCHSAESKLWTGSQHQQAMQLADATTVLGNFNDTEFEYNGVKSQFFRRDSGFFVTTDGHDGTLQTFEIKYTFGVDPLQQYLIEFPDGRIQALSIAWDSRPKENGGQRWFHLYPKDKIDHSDVLHWTKLNQNWNFMCAECHSTGIRKNYDAKMDRYATTWSEISVGCEACHGQGSNHVVWARAQQSWLGFSRINDPTKGLRATLDERKSVVWSRDLHGGMVQRNLAPNLLRKEVETCGRCHARRSEISEDWAPGQWLQQTHVIGNPLGRDVYWADGQIRDIEEPYNYVPFKQSKMFAAGVTCSDCHDPHSGKLRISGSGICLQCHASQPYANDAHSHHKQADAAPNCISCHMPARTYMVIDPRHDHSMRIPRPDLSIKLGTPNACNYCHRDKSAHWAANALERWFGPKRKGFQTYAEAFHTAWTDRVEAEKVLAAVAMDEEAPDIARASALIELAPFLSPTNADLARRGLSNSDPMMRIAAMDMIAEVPPTQIWPLVAPLLRDPVRGVRIRAADLLAAVPAERQPQTDRSNFERAAAELVSSLKLNADRPESRSSLGSFYAKRGRMAAAESELETALRLSPQFAPAAINLADLYRQLGRDSEAERTLRKTIATSPDNAGLHYALGLALTRLKRRGEAIDELRRAREIDRHNPRYAYVYGVALDSAGRRNEAMSVLKQNLVTHPNHRDTLTALLSYSRAGGDIVAALTYAKQLAQFSPTDPRLKALVEDLSSQVEKTNRN